MVLTVIINSCFNYKILIDTLWDTEDYKGQLVWSWLIHLTKEKWINRDIFKDLVIVLFFAQDYFKTYKPVNSKNVSNAQSIYIGQQLVELRLASNEQDGMGLDLSSKKASNKVPAAFKGISSIKLLDID